MLKIFLISIILVGIAFVGLGIRLLLDRNVEFSGGRCQVTPDGLKEQGISFGCGAGNCASEEEKP